MFAQILEKPLPITAAPLKFVEITEIPDPGDHQIKIKVRTCGVCHTDLHTVEGDLDIPALPLIPGHQVVGTVVKIGAQVNRFQVGDRVGIGWLNSTCGVCEFCKKGYENLCPNACFTGLHQHGGYAEYLLIHENFAFTIPDVFDDVTAAPLLCAGIIGYRSLLISGIQQGERLGLFGFGASAHLVIQVARHWDCDVHVFTRSEKHRRLAESLGAAWAGSIDDLTPERLDAGITFAPVGELIPNALVHLKPGATLAINAVHLSPIPQIDYPLIYGERGIKSVANFTRKDAEDFLSLAGKIPIQTTVETYPLAEANLVLRKLKHSEIKGAAVLKVS